MIFIKISIFLLSVNFCLADVPDADQKYYQILSGANDKLYLTTGWSSGLSEVTLENYRAGDPEMNEGENSPSQGWQLTFTEKRGDNEWGWKIFSSSWNNNKLTKRSSWGEDIFYDFVSLGNDLYQLKDLKTGACVISNGLSRSIAANDCNPSDTNQQFIFKADE